MKGLTKIGSVLILASAMLLGLPSLLDGSVSAAGCVLTSAAWGVSSTTINKPTPMTVQGQGCKGYVVAIHAYTMSGGAEITPTGGLTATFTNDTSVTVTHSFNPPGYGASGIVQIFFNASANNTQVNSGGILLGVTSETPPPITVTPPPIITPAPSTQGVPGQPVNYQFNVPNPINANDFISLITEISKWIVAIAIPIAVIAIVYAGILWLTAGAYPKNVDNAKRVLRYALIGLAIIIIGRGFITLIESIINLGGSSGTPATSQGATPLPSTLPTSSSKPSSTPTPNPGKPIGSRCIDDDSCVSPLLCGATSICRRPGWNLSGDPCKATSDCRAGLTCNNETQNQQVIDGQTLGTCR